MMNVYWLEQTEADVPPGEEWLSDFERSRLSALRVAQRRADWRLGRWTAKRSVARYRGLPVIAAILSTIEIKPASSGAPEVFIEQEPAPLSLSLSHREGRALCAVATWSAAIGCDVECVEPRSDAFIADYFTLSEQAVIQRGSNDERYLNAALLWSAKESALKALRTGLLLDTRCVTVTLAQFAPIAGWSPLHVDCVGGERFHGWWNSCGSFVRTIVAAPHPARPINLELSASSRMAVPEFTATHLRPEYVGG